MKTIYLNTLSGAEFEGICEKIFSAYYGVFVEKTPLVNDKGRDLIIHQNDGEVFVECKHHPNSSIGRPIVQKLHSAMITENISKGMIVTTGHFSRDAIEHVLTNQLPIELIDLEKLKEIAHKAGYMLLCSETDTQGGTIFYLSPEDEQIFQTHLASYLNKKLDSAPQSIGTLLNIKQKDSELRSAYRVDFQLHADFSTSIGLIHSENCAGSLYVLENELAVCADQLAETFSHSKFLPYTADVSTPLASINRYKTINEITERAQTHIIETHTRQVTYCGKNNREYTKTCTPSKKDIFIENIVHLYLPFSFVEFMLAGRTRKISLAENQTDDFFVFNNEFLNCETCHKPIRKGLLCNDCGSFAHVSKKKTHGFNCTLCGKTICISCAAYFRKYLFLKKPVCHSCATEQRLKTKKYKIKL